MAHKQRDGSLSVLLLTDVFPPKSGGSGWSTLYLGRALQARGHRVKVVRPISVERNGLLRPNTVEYGGLPVHEVPVAPPPPWTTQLGLNRAASEERATRALATEAFRLARSGPVDILHGQHMISIRASMDAASQLRAAGARPATVATIRDYWPLCPVSTRLLTNASGEIIECRNCFRLSEYLSSEGAVSTPRRATSTARWLRTLRIARKAAQAGLTVAVSDYVRTELARSGRFSSERILTVPNLVDLQAVDSALSAQPVRHEGLPEGDFMLFVGKLDLNKGAQMLPELMQRSDLSLPLAVAGDGPLRPTIAAEARACGVDFRFLDWVDNNDVLRLMRRARVLIFPSAWQDPLSRVLLEACASGAAIVALNTGGTFDIVRNGVSGWLAGDLSGLAEGLRRVATDPELNAHLRAGARRRAEERFAAPVVAAQMEAAYRRAMGYAA